MALAPERPPRTITCADCGKSEQRSPYGPAPTTCVSCDQLRDRSRKRGSAATRSRGIRAPHTRSTEARP